MSVTGQSTLLWRLTGDSGRHVECHLTPLGTGDCQLTILYNGLEATTEVYVCAFVARARAKQLVTMLHTKGWRLDEAGESSSDPDEDSGG
jgi:hypothetical protein